MASPELADPAGIDALIASRLLALRQARGLSLSELAMLCGVSKATVSKIERAQSSPSAMILGRLAAGLGISLAELLTDENAQPPQRLRRRADQALWRDPELGYRRRQVAERDVSQGPEMVEIELPRGAQVHYPRWSGTPYRQRLWMVEGELRVAYGDEVFELAPGDCLGFGVERPLSFKALGGRGCRYLLVISAG